MKLRGLTPKLLTLDNEMFEFPVGFLFEENISIQLVPPYLHRRGATEWDIRTVKDHL